MFQGGIHIRTVKKGHMRVKGAGELERDTMHCAEEGIQPHVESSLGPFSDIS